MGLPLVQSIIKLGQLSLQFGRVKRVTRHEDGERLETDTDHTVMLGLISCAFADRLNRRDNPDDLEQYRYDLGLVAQFAFIHDFVEVHAGDTDTLNVSTSTAQDKEKREAAALAQLREEMRELPWVCTTIDRYNSLDTPEARFVKALDKVLPKITVILNRAAHLRERAPDLSTIHPINLKQIEKLRQSYGADQPEAIDLLENVCEELRKLLELPKCEVLESRHPDDPAPDRECGAPALGLSADGIAVCSRCEDDDTLKIVKHFTPCCPNENRDVRGGCLSCGAPCL